MGLGDNIKARRRTLGYTVEELAERLGVSRQTVFRYENGQIATVPSDKLAALAEILGTTPAVLMGYTTTPPTETYFSVAAGGASSADVFTVTAIDDAMSGARILEGDTVYCRSCGVKNGDIVAARIDERLLLRRIYRYPDEKKLLLVPENPRFEPIVLLGDETKRLALLGKAIAFKSLLE